MVERRVLAERLAVTWIVVIAAVRVVAWLAAGAPTTPGESQAAYLIIVVAFGAASMLLAWGAYGRDPRAAPLALAYLLVSTTYADWGAAAVPRPPELIALVLHPLQPAVFLPYAVWSFFSVFPQAPLFPREVQRLERVRAAAYVLGLVLFAIQLLPAALVRGEGVSPFAVLPGMVHWSHPLGGKWVLLGLVTVPAFLVAALRARRAPVDERRRASVFLAGVLVGGAPPLLHPALLALVPALNARRDDPELVLLIQTVEYSGVFLVLLATGYAILARRALNVRFIVRRTIQYALARNVLLVVAALPFAFIMLVAYRNRARPVGELFAEAELALLVGFTLGGIALTRLRVHAVAWIDRLFFREQYDARRILASLVDKVSDAPDAAALARLCSDEIERALHPERIALLYASPHRPALVSPARAVRPLPSDSLLLERLAEHTKPIDVEWEPPSNVVRHLAPEDRHWLADAGFRLLLPLRGADRRVIGILGLGEKRSELPYSGEDRELLVAIAGALALALENRLLQGSAVQATRASSLPAGLPVADGEAVGHVCTACGIVEQARDFCTACGGALEPGDYPLVLAGKYELIERIGRGGMGIVFRARDRTLGRDVAIKTLPTIDAERAARLRREARAMAALTHPNLAMILAAEIWHGTPYLVFEYLAGGTLAERLRADVLPESAVIALGLTLARALERVHEAGILHRDIKPGNIGYTADGVPKILDFGLARLAGLAQQTGARPQPPVRTTPASTPSWGDSRLDLTRTDAVVGTVLYLSPETLEGRAPGPSVDLWSTNVVLYECLAGHNPFHASDERGVLRNILTQDVPDVRSYRPDVSARLASYLNGALARDARQRPRSAAEIRDRLSRIGLRAA